jgi:hypothetical protein
MQQVLNFIVYNNEWEAITVKTGQVFCDPCRRITPEYAAMESDFKNFEDNIFY